MRNKENIGQYGRRLRVRISGIPSQKNESAEDVRNSVKSVIEESRCDIPDIAQDCGHRIGKYDPSGKNVRPFIVRFTTFRYRALFYRARKNLSKNGVHLDLTKQRFTLYQKTRDLVKSKTFIKYVYVDVNRGFKVKFENNKESFFSSISELLDLTDEQNNLGVLGQRAEGNNVRCFFCRLLFVGH